MDAHHSKREAGQGIVEYALIMVLVSLIALGSMSAMGISLRDVYQTIANAFNGSEAAEAIRTFYSNTFDDDLSGWSEAKWGSFYGGRWRVQDGKLKGDRFAALFLDDFSRSDYTLTAKGVVFANTNPVWNGGALYFRTDTNARSGYVFEIEQRNPGKDALIHFRKWANGYEINPPLASAPVPAGYNFESPTDIQIRVEGDTFTAYMNGAQVLQTSDSTYSSGTVGIASNWGSRMEIDDILINETP